MIGDRMQVKNKWINSCETNSYLLLFIGLQQKRNNMRMKNEEKYGQKRADVMKSCWRIGADRWVCVHAKKDQRNDGGKIHYSHKLIEGADIMTVWISDVLHLHHYRHIVCLAIHDDEQATATCMFGFDLICRWCDLRSMCYCLHLAHTHKHRTSKNMERKKDWKKNYV